MVMLKSSFDNRWQVTVDGAPMPAQMVAPSYVGRTVPAGRHVVRFSYTPFPYYWLLFALAGVTLLGLWLVRRRVGGPEPVVAGRPGAGYPS